MPTRPAGRRRSRRDSRTRSISVEGLRRVVARERTGVRRGGRAREAEGEGRPVLLRRPNVDASSVGGDDLPCDVESEAEALAAGLRELSPLERLEDRLEAIAAPCPCSVFSMCSRGATGGGGRRHGGARRVELMGERARACGSIGRADRKRMRGDRAAEIAPSTSSRTSDRGCTCLPPNGRPNANPSRSQSSPNEIATPSVATHDEDA